MQERKFSFVAFIIGLIVGFVLAGLIAALTGMYLYNAFRSGMGGDQGGIAQALETEVRRHIEMEEERSTSVYGTVTKIEGSVIEIEAPAAIGTELLQFRFDQNTVAVRLNNDDESTEIPIRIEELAVGEGVTILTNEPTGSVADQYAVKIVNF